MTTLRFSKMHGLGNDFMVIDGVRQHVSLNPEQIRTWADRHLSIGFDQLLLVQAPSVPNTDFTYRIYNADGGEVEQCGNGARCFGRFVRDQGLTDKNELRVSTAGGPISIELKDDGRIRVEMGEPVFEPAQIPFQADDIANSYPLQAADQQIHIGAVSMGNPHALLWVDDINSAPVAELGPAIEGHQRFPNRVNAGFAQLIDENAIRLRVFERGVGETLACGSGACAAMAIGRQQGKLADHVTVNMRGGALDIDWQGPGHVLWQTGPASHVFDAEITL